PDRAHLRRRSFGSTGLPQGPPGVGLRRRRGRLAPHHRGLRQALPDRGLRRGPPGLHREARAAVEGALSRRRPRASAIIAITTASGTDPPVAASWADGARAGAAVGAVAAGLRAANDSPAT